jgi:type IV pilus assembly protein PilC
MAVSDTLKHDFLLIALAAVGLVFLVRWWKGTKRGRDVWDRIKLRTPVFGSLWLKTAMARFARTLGVLNRSGVPILQSLEVVSETVNNTLVQRAVMDIQDSVKRGESISRPLRAHKVFPPMVVQMLAVGEETGALDTMLDKVAAFYDDEVTASVDQLTSLIEPVMIAMVGAMVGVAVIALYMPMFNVIKLIK